MKKIVFVCLTALLFGGPLMAQVSQTVTINATASPVLKTYRWGTNFGCSGTTYSKPAGSIHKVGFRSTGWSGCFTEESYVLNAKFNHPQFTNADITSIVLRYDVQGSSLTGSPYPSINVHAPSQSCANSSTNSTIFSCVNIPNGGAFTALASSQSTTANWVSKSITINSGTNPNLAIFNSSSTYFHIGFDAWSKIANVKNVRCDITYTYCPTLSAPSGFTATGASNSQINLNWNSVPNATQYEIYACNGSLVNTTSSTSYSVTGLPANTNRSYRVRAKSSCATSSFASCQSATTAPTAPTISSTYSGSVGVNIYWSTVPGATGYQVYSCQNTLLANLGVSATSYNSGVIGAGTSRQYKIRATSASGNSAFSGCVTAYTRLAIPSGLSAVAQSTSSIALNWNAVPSAGSYSVFQENLTTGATTTFSVTNPNYLVSGIPAGTNFRFEVSARGGSPYPNSNFSPSFGTQTHIVAPVISVNALSLVSIQLNWNAVVGACSYSVYSCNGAFIGSTSGTSYNLGFNDFSGGLDAKVRANSCNSSFTVFSNCVEVFEGPVDNAPIFFRNATDQAGSDNRNAVTVFPNPSNGLFYLQVSNTAVQEMTVVDLLGKIVWSQTDANVTQFDISDFPDGIYLLKYQVDGATHVQKLVKN